jgi:hypothetical protein
MDERSSRLSEWALCIEKVLMCMFCQQKVLIFGVKRAAAKLTSPYARAIVSLTSRILRSIALLSSCSIACAEDLGRKSQSPVARSGAVNSDKDESFGGGRGSAPMGFCGWHT